MTIKRKHKVVNLYIPIDLLPLAIQAAFNQGFVFDGKGNLSKWVTQLIEKELKQNEH